MQVTYHRAIHALAVLIAVACASAPASAQSVTFGGREVQVHGSFQQAWVVTDDNNFLTMNSREGSGEFTDAAFNASTQVNKRLRVGAQIYSRNIGQLGNGEFQFDWAYADYRVHPAFGVRAGKMKTALGLYNDTQDMEFLHTWALLPQAVYPLDLRAVTIAHVGVDFYGTVGLRKAGSLQYTTYYGQVPDDDKGGYRYGVEDNLTLFTEGISSTAFGGDARWTTPVEGLMVGASAYQMAADTQVVLGPTYPVPMLRGQLLDVDIPRWRRWAAFGDYQHDRLHVAAEFRKETSQQQYALVAIPLPMTPDNREQRGSFVSAAYRLHDKFEVGSYYSSYVANTALDASLDNNHIASKVLTGRVDITPFWNVKVEGHFIDGYGNLTYARGFYRRVNTTGLLPETKMLVVRTGINF
jgi:hypothetical protein